MRIFLTLREEHQSTFINPIFVGYKPVVWATAEKNPLPESGEYCLHFHSENVFFDPISRWKGFPADNHSVARMIIRLLPVKFESLPGVSLFQGKCGRHSFINPLHKISNALRQRFVRSQPGNVDLPGNLHDMVRIAYSIPRIVSLVSVSDGNVMNLFPTDLHGQLTNDFYISSLRIGGKAQEQVQQCKKIVISEVDSNQFVQAYQLGKNHMKELSDPMGFQLSQGRSEKFGFYLPTGVLRYFELEMIEFIDVGIHRIFLYKIIHAGRVAKGNTLAHIHQYYAEWRKRHGIPTELLLRKS